MALLEISRRGYIKRIYGVISAGKEARVYWGKDSSGNDIAIKIYLTATAEFRKSIWKYIVGDPRFENIPRGDIRKLIYAWTRKEYRNLKRYYEVGVRVPKPIFVYKNILVMEFIGKNGVRAPLLKEAAPSLDTETLLKIHDKVIEYVEIGYHKAKLVHADLSEFNIMVLDGEPVIIDVSQAVHLDHPKAHVFLYRDLRNIYRYFNEELGLDVPNPEEVFRRITRCNPPQYLE